MQMSTVKFVLIAFVINGLLAFTMVALLRGLLPRIALSVVLWTAVAVVYVVRHKRSMDERERFARELAGDHPARRVGGRRD